MLEGRSNLTLVIKGASRTSEILGKLGCFLVL